ncbi:MAG: NAD(P)-binding domain-containing protein [Geminicoccaceae bacterium]
MKVGFIGLGIMGKPMALNLRQGGHELLVKGGRSGVPQELVEAGARNAPRAVPWPRVPR